MDPDAAWQLLILMSLAPLVRLNKDWSWSPVAAQTAAPTPGARHLPMGGAEEPEISRAAFEAQFAPQRAALRAHIAMAEAGARLQAERDGPELRAMMDRLKAEWLRGTALVRGDLLPPGPKTLTWPADRTWAQETLRAHLAALTEVRARLDRDHGLMTGLLKICGTGFLIWLEQETDRTRGFLGLAKPAPAIRIVQRRIQIAPNALLNRPAPPPTSLSRAAAIRKIATSRVIPHLTHVTEARNLRHILQEGLRPGPSGLACSITFPNDQAFARARLCSPGSPWVVLILARHILWSEDCLFAQATLAPDPSPEALEALFSGPQRAKALLPCDPDDLRAHVLVKSRIAPDLIEALAFETPEALEAHRPLIGPREAFACGMAQGLFGPAPRRALDQA